MQLNNESGKRPWSLIEFWNKSDDNKVPRSSLKQQRASMIDTYQDWMSLTSRMPQVVCRESLEWEIPEVITETITNFEINKYHFNLLLYQRLRIFTDQF